MTKDEYVLLLGAFAFGVVGWTDFGLSAGWQFVAIAAPCTVAALGALVWFGWLPHENWRKSGTEAATVLSSLALMLIGGLALRL